MLNSRPFVLTTGDLAGVGVDIILELASRKKLNTKCPVIVLGDHRVFLQRSKELGLSANLTLKVIDVFEHSQQVFADIVQYANVENFKKKLQDFQEKIAAVFVKKIEPKELENCLYVYDIQCELSTEKISCKSLLNYPKPRAANVLLQLNIAHLLVSNNICAGIITGPISKNITQIMDCNFVDHTSYFAKLAGVEYPVMMLMNDKLKVALLTVHCPLRDVPAMITNELLMNIISNLHRGLQQYFAISSPVIRVAGLNPHAGESGALGDEETKVINPFIKNAQSQGYNVFGSYPADTMFSEQHLMTTDVFLVMYHDQGLPVLKYSEFYRAANITLGLPFIRTSVDHGTAFELAGTGRASSLSLEYAIEIANFMLNNSG